MSEETKRRPENRIGLWNKTTKDGSPYMGGSISKDELLKLVGLMQGDKVSFQVYPNQYKNEPKHPDFNLNFTSYTSTRQPDVKPRDVLDDLDLPF